MRQATLLLHEDEPAALWCAPAFAPLLGAVVHGEAACAALLARFDVVLDGDNPCDPPRLREGLRAARLCRSLDALRHWRRARGAATLLFRPDARARLDAIAETRATLCLARRARKGEPVTAELLAEERGGRGVGASLRPALIGRLLAYDLPARAPVDFGMVLPR
ncbi:MAG: hypothetical protein IT557_12480 [Alphaproteobacteria bacterium]|nr:hypothetical protein [Alphaproteobacteria bacterium]